MQLIESSSELRVSQPDTPFSIHTCHPVCVEEAEGEGKEGKEGEEEEEEGEEEEEEEVVVVVLALYTYMYNKTLCESK